MAGSGRGRGRASFTFNIEAIGFSKGAVLPDVVCKPPPLFPNDRRVEAGIGPSVPTAAPAGASREDYPGPCPGGFWSCLAWRSEGFRETSEAIERYSKKYMDDEKEHAAWTPDWRRLPREMKPRKKMKKGAKPKKAKNSEPKSNVDVLKKIEELEKKDDEEEKSDDEKDRTKDKEGEDDEEAEEPEEYDEEEHEEENDYISSYFEDGDDFGAGSDDNMDEATY
ncbi:DNA-directed RNA polymerase III subunit RPC7 isoform X2 [Centrocercus urophasianus]|uniref:DNA-directed RNA polymerase III subunit RPC7 isoform X2 n=1 Tax=Centrocercus urophasianus TaxID=9002 RepID=UPI001C646829|nr:DNA-directed RNA polymerase III subunit RPC7 isoform X2 [Centrocercus urophasianus]